MLSWPKKLIAKETHRDSSNLAKVTDCESTYLVYNCNQVIQYK